MILDRILALHPPGLSAFVGIELEFYLVGANDQVLQSIVSALSCALVAETGIDQYEVIFDPTSDIRRLVCDIDAAKRMISDIGSSFGLQTTFAAKPFVDQPGSGMHVHLNYRDLHGANLFANVDNKDSDYLLYAAGGLCRWLASHMLFFAPNEESYLRFAKFGHNTPTRINWGGNNRTASIRIPDINGNQQSKRLEHRTPGSDSDPYQVISAILGGALYGIHHKVVPPPKTHGLSFDEQYALPMLPTSLFEAAAVHQDMDALIAQLIGTAH